jgi:hypothetical protein
VTKVSFAQTDSGGKVDSPRDPRDAGESTDPSHCERAAMTATSATAGRLQTGRPETRTGGPDDNGPKIVEHLAGWTFVVVLAMLVTQLGMI